MTGNSIIIAIGELRPGRAPTNNPRNVPKNNKVKLKGIDDDNEKKINNSQVRCIVQDKLDRYKRYIGVCFAGSINLNQWMVISKTIGH